MKNVKVVFWLLILGFVALVVYQNKDIFLADHILSLDLGFKKYQTPEFANGLLVLGCFLVGFLFSYFFSLSERFRSKKMIKDLKGSYDANSGQVAALKEEVETLRRDATLHSQSLPDRDSQDVPDGPNTDQEI